MALHDVDKSGLNYRAAERPHMYRTPNGWFVKFHRHKYDDIEFDEDDENEFDEDNDDIEENYPPPTPQTNTQPIHCEDAAIY
jgi:hypothetical protein